MSPIGLYIELKEGRVKSTNLELLTLAHKSGREALAVVFGNEAGGYAGELQEYGAKRIIHVSGLHGQGYHPETYARVLAEIIGKEEIPDFICTHSAQGKDLLPRVAALIEAPLVTDCTGIDLENNIATKPLYAGRVIARVKIKGERRLYTLRPNTIRPEKVPRSSKPVIETMAASPETILAEIKEIVKSIARRIELTEARVIVSGGRGMKSGENFKILEELAEALGAAVGASRAAVDAGYAPQSIQVGQTGKTVSPVLYIACGISGASQHFAGMKTSRVIVAINKDPEAPIFKKADYGIVGDLFEVVPLLIQEFEKTLKVS